MGKKNKDDSSESDAGDVEQRETWSNPAEFVLCCLGYAVGLGNVWRFPYICFKNGGGAFLIPYAIMLTFVGIPVFFMELLMAQYSGKGPLHIWAVSPIFRGIGVGMMFINMMICVFYTMIIGYSLYYLVLSFFDPLPWDTCKNDFNSDRCYNKNEAEPCELQNGTWFNLTCYNETYLSTFDEPRQYCNVTSCFSYDHNIVKEELANLTAKSISSTEEYLNQGILQMSNGVEDTGKVVWQLVVALLAGWLLCYICLIKGIKSSGKAVYFTALFPYVVLLILLIYGCTLPGSFNGILFYVTPDWEKLKTATVWADAAAQIFFSLSVGAGGLMTFASYNKFHNNIYRDALIVSIGNCLTSLFAGFAIFAILGYMAHTLNKEVPDVVVDGSTLAFVAYPTALARMPVAQLWAVLFFIMLVTLGLDSLFAGMETNVTAFVDSFPRTRKFKWLITLLLCIAFFLLGLTLTTQSGIYWLNIIAYYATGWSLIIVGLLETIVFAWIYGAKHMRAHVKEMCGFSIGIHWWICWTIISPLIILAILGFSIYDFKPLSFGPYQLPEWAQAIGWMIAMFPVAAVVVGAVFAIAMVCCCCSSNRQLTCRKRAAMLFRPSPQWGPSESKQKDTGKNGGFGNGPGRANNYALDDDAMDKQPPGYNNSGFTTEL